MTLKQPPTPMPDAENPNNTPLGDAESMDAGPLTFRIGILGAFVAPAVFLAGVVTFFVIHNVLDMNALTVAGLVGLLVAALLARSYSRFWKAVVAGVASPTSVLLLLIFLAVGAVAAMISQADVSGGFVWLAGQIGVGGGVFACLTFVMVCAISMATGSSFGALFTAFPIFYPAGVVLGADPVLLAGAILSGALFGDNLAPISDSTIVSASTQRYRRRAGTADIGGVVRSRARYALTAALLSAAGFLVLGVMLAGGGAPVVTGEQSGGPLSLIMLVPIAALLLTAFWKRDIMLAATVGLASGVVIGIGSGLFAPADVLSVTEDGALAGFLASGVADMLPMIGLAIVVFGIVGVLDHAGIFDLLVGWSGRSAAARGPRGAEAAIAFGAVATTVVFAGINSPAMLMFGPVADRIGGAAGLHPYRKANIMDCFTLGLGAIIPLGSVFLLIASQLTQGLGDGVPGLTSLEVFPAALYPLILTVVMIVSILTGWGRRFEGVDGEPVRTLAA
jgi:Na+/H+ antiporter NhaC